jgi:glycosyltransferase involved in cell wall biosynthesis
MKVLVVHNYYQHGGGEDAAFRAETALLRGGGHEVVEYTRTNLDITPSVAKVKLAATTIWSGSSHRVIGELLARERPAIAHFHNTLPLISPAAYYACRDAGVPVVQTLHNYRLVCPAANLFRDDHVCEECLEHNVSRAVTRGCYRSSRTASAVVATMLAAHRALGTWRDQVNVYIAPSEFSRQKLLAAGLPAARVVVKPHFVHPDPGPRAGSGNRALFVGRLSAEKGAATLLHAWKRLGGCVPLDIIGDGPERGAMEAIADGTPGVRFLGRLPREQTLAAMTQARVLVFPSECYETFGLSIVEGFACGIPVIASRLGAMKEIVADGVTGLHFAAGDATDLAAKVGWAWSHPQATRAMGEAARAEFEAKYTGARNYRMLMAIYRAAIASKSGTSSLEAAG